MVSKSNQVNTVSMEESRRAEIMKLVHAQIPAKDISNVLSIPMSTVYEVKARCSITGTVRRKSGSGKIPSVRTPELIKAVRDRIRRNPVRSMREMARSFNVSEKTMRTVVKKDLKAKSRARVKRQLLTAKTKAARLERCKVLLSRLKKGAPLIMFTDEKVFTVDKVSNSRTDRYISSLRVEDVPEHVRIIGQTKHPTSIMMFGLICSDGEKMPPVFIDSGIRMDSKKYIGILEDHVKPWIESTYGPGVAYVFQQDGAPCHTSKLTQTWLAENLQNFWAKEIWPPSSPDLNPLDFSIWAAVQAKAGVKAHSNVKALKSAIVKTWQGMSEAYIISTCKAFRPRIEKCIKCEGGHFE